MGCSYIFHQPPKGLNLSDINLSFSLLSINDQATRTIPIVTQIGLDLGYFLGGVFIVEAVFGLPGIGKQAIEAIGQLDIPMIMGTVLFAALLIVLSNIAVDLSYALIDPRIRYR